MTSDNKDQLTRRVLQWVEQGYIGPHGAKAILGDINRSEEAAATAGAPTETGSPGLPAGQGSAVDRPASSWSDSANRAQEMARTLLGTGFSLDLIGILSMLGAILIGIGAISFVAANWQDMPRLARLAILAGGLWAAYGAAAELFRRDLAMFAHAAVFIGSSLFGACVMLVAQMYHIHGKPTDAVMLWAAGALCAGAVFRSNPSSVLALGLVCLWGIWETQAQGEVVWLFAPAWAAVTGVLMLNGCRYGVNLAVPAITIWLISIGYTMPGLNGHLTVLAMGLVIGGIGLSLQQAGGIYREPGRVAMMVGFCVAIAALLGLQFVERVSLGSLLMFAALTLGLALAVIAWGIRTDESLVTRIGYGAFAVEVVALFIKTAGSLIGSSLFFVVTGAGIIALAALAYWIDRHLRATAQASDDRRTAAAQVDAGKGGAA